MLANLILQEHYFWSQFSSRIQKMRWIKRFVSNWCIWVKKNYGNFVLRHSLQWNEHFRFRYILSEGTSQSLIKFSRTCGITSELHPCTEQFSITRDHSAHWVRSTTYPSYDAKWISYLSDGIRTFCESRLPSLPWGP